MHYYQFNIGDYAAHTRHLSLMEDLAYRRLLDLYYSSEKPLINDTKKLARLIIMQGHESEIEQVLEDFFTLTDDGFTQNRVKEEITKFHSKADAARANGKKGGRPKKPNPNPEKTQLVNSANPEESGCKTKQETRTNKQETVNKKQSRGFTKPTPDQLVSYFESKGSGRYEAERFWHYYESNGWKVGRNPMKKWESAVANWLKNAKPANTMPANQETLSEVSMRTL